MRLQCTAQHSLHSWLPCLPARQPIVLAWAGLVALSEIITKNEFLKELSCKVKVSPSCSSTALLEYKKLANCTKYCYTPWQLFHWWNKRKEKKLIVQQALGWQLFHLAMIAMMGRKHVKILFSFQILYNYELYEKLEALQARWPFLLCTLVTLLAAGSYLPNWIGVSGTI